MCNSHYETQTNNQNKDSEEGRVTNCLVVSSIHLGVIHLLWFKEMLAVYLLSSWMFLFLGELIILNEKNLSLCCSFHAVSRIKHINECCSLRNPLTEWLDSTRAVLLPSKMWWWNFNMNKWIQPSTPIMQCSGDISPWQSNKKQSSAHQIHVLVDRHFIIDGYDTVKTLGAIFVRGYCIVGSLCPVRMELISCSRSV